MKNSSENRLFRTLLFFLIVGVIAKVIWLAISITFLPKSGIEHIEVSKAKALYYRIKLANPSKKIIKKAPVKKAPVIGTMKGIKLIALYNASDALVVTVEKAKKTKVLSRDDKKDNSIDGFVLSSAGPNYAIFKKNGKEFKLIIESSKIKNSSYIRVSKSASTSKEETSDNSGIVESEDGIGKIVPKGLLSSYTKDINKVWKDIGIGEYKVNGQLQGFKVNFVKKGSDFEKLGLKRGDILKAVNGEELNSYKSAYSFYGEMGSIENLTLSIKRNNQDMELEYEIK
jgi:general secretion pathway protein C